MISRLLASPLVRFLIVGGINTVATYGIFVLLGLLIQPWIAYTIAFFLGLVWITFGSSRYVFGSRSPARIATFVAWYVVLYALGRAIIHIINPSGLPSLLLASLAVIAISVPLTYVGGRFIFRKPSERLSSIGPDQEGQEE